MCKDESFKASGYETSCPTSKKTEQSNSFTLDYWQSAALPKRLPVITLNLTSSVKCGGHQSVSH